MSQNYNFLNAQNNPEDSFENISHRLFQKINLKEYSPGLYDNLKIMFLLKPHILNFIDESSIKQTKIYTRRHIDELIANPEFLHKKSKMVLYNVGINCDDYQKEEQFECFNVLKQSKLQFISNLDYYVDLMIKRIEKLKINEVSDIFSCKSIEMKTLSKKYLIDATTYYIKTQAIKFKESYEKYMSSLGASDILKINIKLILITWLSDTFVNEKCVINKDVAEFPNLPIEYEPPSNFRTICNDEKVCMILPRKMKYINNFNLESNMQNTYPIYKKNAMSNFMSQECCDAMLKWNLTGNSVIPSNILMLLLSGKSK